MLHGPGREEEAGAARLTGNVPAGLAGTYWQSFLICRVPTKHIRDRHFRCVHFCTENAALSWHSDFVIRRSMTFRAYAHLCDDFARTEACSQGRSEWEEAARDWRGLAEAAFEEEQAAQSSRPFSAAG